MRIDTNVKTSTQILFPAKQDPEEEKWINFVESLRSQREKKLPEPFYIIDTLISNYLQQEEDAGSILDVGCETGKNAVPLIEAGYKVTLLDIAPNAIQYTLETLKNLGLEQGVAETIKGKVETLDPKYGPFKAVVGTYVFSFIAPNQFLEVMQNKLLNQVEVGGYFAGGFFGPDHAWAKGRNISIMTRQKLEELFESSGFVICEIDELKKEVMTVFSGQQLFHTIGVIARKVLKTEKTVEERFLN